MDAQTNLLIISDDFSLYETIKRASVTGDFNLFFSQTNDDYLAIVRGNGIRVALVDSGDSIAGALVALKKLKKFDALIDVSSGANRSTGMPSWTSSTRARPTSSPGLIGTTSSRRSSGGSP